jgi:ATP-dependent RNA helicase DDX19/DBP5
MRFERPSAVQATTIPYIQDGMNVIAQAQAGSGKTISFTIGMLSRIDPNIQAVQALCLTPTRDLAQQIINDAVVRLACRMPGVKVEPALPGYNQDLLPVKSHIVVGTPGKVKDWITRGVLNVSQVKVFVLDEADEMVKQGAKTLAAETIAIKNKLPSSCQILLLSATYPPQVLTYAQRIVDNAVTVKLASDQELILSELFQVNMDVNKVSTGGKLQILRDIYDFMTVSQSIIFVETKVEAQSVSKLMNDMGFGVSVLTGDLEGAVRDQTLQDFRDGKSKVLITTNVLARGVDIPAVAVVVNYDVPGSKAPSGKFFEDACSVYVHRIGRCSRFGRRGVAINLLQTEQDFATMSAIENHYSPGKRMTKDWDPRNIEELRDFIENRSAAEAEA